MSVYRTIGPLVVICDKGINLMEKNAFLIEIAQIIQIFTLPIIK